MDPSAYIWVHKQQSTTILCTTVPTNSMNTTYHNRTTRPRLLMKNYLVIKF